MVLGKAPPGLAESAKMDHLALKVLQIFEQIFTQSIGFSAVLWKLIILPISGRNRGEFLARALSGFGRLCCFSHGRNGTNPQDLSLPQKIQKKPRCPHQCENCERQVVL